MASTADDMTLRSILAVWIGAVSKVVIASSSTSAKVQLDMWHQIRSIGPCCWQLPT
jgi:hypothetical protein